MTLAFLKMIHPFMNMRVHKRKLEKAWANIGLCVLDRPTYAGAFMFLFSSDVSSVAIQEEINENF
jgi:hypothetical protein